MPARFPACACLVVAAVVAGLMAAKPLTAQAPAKRVLIIHGGPESFPGNLGFDAAIRQTLFLHPTMAVEAHSEYLENEEFADTAAEALSESLRIKFRNRPIDLVVSNTAPTLQFVLQHRDDLFAGVPIVFAAATVPAAVLQGKVPQATGIVREGSQVETLDLALKIHPGTKRIHVVAYAPVVEGFNERVRTTLAPFSKRVTITFSSEPTLPGMLAMLRTLPADTLIFFVRYSPVTKGRIIFPDEMLPEIVQAAPVPIYCSLDSYMGKGVVGGMMRSGQNTGERLGEIARKVLEGAAPESIPIEPAQLRTIFDWRELQRWGIDESRLPPGSEIRFRIPTVWQLYGTYIIATVVVVCAQLVLIAGLLYQRRARQQAELDSRRNLALAADAIRRQTMSALTSSIAHEVGQPLSSMIHNAQAARLMITASRATPDSMDEILSDIESEAVLAAQIIDRHRTMLRGHQLDQKSIDLHTVIHESLALVAHDMRARQIEVSVNPGSNPCIIPGDQVLLQQVLVNLIRNAMDAMADTPPTRRRITIATEVRAADVQVSVRDAGTGLPPEIEGTLFTPFVTTKADGLGIGLTITRRIVEAHGGSIEAHNNPGGGATFTVTLHRGETSKPLSGPPHAA